MRKYSREAYLKRLQAESNPSPARLQVSARKIQLTYTYAHLLDWTKIPSSLMLGFSVRRIPSQRTRQGYAPKRRRWPRKMCQLRGKLRHVGRLQSMTENCKEKVHRVELTRSDVQRSRARTSGSVLPLGPSKALGKGPIFKCVQID